MANSQLCGCWVHHEGYELPAVGCQLGDALTIVHDERGCQPEVLARALCSSMPALMRDAVLAVS